MSTLFVKLIQLIDLILTAHSFLLTNADLYRQHHKGIGYKAKLQILLTARLSEPSSQSALNLGAGVIYRGYRGDTLSATLNHLRACSL
jgi:hypothetical protein